MWPKGETRQQRKARDKRLERRRIQEVRPACVDRDGYCRFYYQSEQLRAEVWAIVGGCRGGSQWSHYNATHRRSKTMRQDPDDRHDTKFSMMLCAFHSQEYDQNRMHIETLTDKGCDGPLRVERDGKAWEETE